MIRRLLTVKLRYHSAYYILQIALCTALSSCTIHIVFCTLHSLYCTLHNAQYTLYIVLCLCPRLRLMGQENVLYSRDCTISGSRKKINSYLQFWILKFKMSLGSACLTSLAPHIFTIAPCACKTSLEPLYFSISQFIPPCLC